MRLHSIVAVGLLACTCLLLYGFGLTSAPVRADEAVLLHNAHAIAGGGLSLGGSGFPLFVQEGESIWLQPLPVYWLLCLLAYLDRPRRWLVAMSTACLGMGVYSTSSSPVTMVCFAFMTGVVLWRHGSRSPTLYAAALAGFTAPLILLVAWYSSHPETYGDTMGRWAIHAAHLRNPWDGLRAFVNWTTLCNRAQIYRDLLNSAFLFLGAKTSAIGLTGITGPFLISTALFLVAGLMGMAVAPTAPQIVLLLGFGGAPLAASTYGEPNPLDRALVVLPFAVLIAACGIAPMLSMRSRALRLAGAALLLLLPPQFVVFCRHYLAG